VVLSGRGGRVPGDAGLLAFREVKGLVCGAGVGEADEVLADLAIECGVEVGSFRSRRGVTGGDGRDRH